MRYVAAGRTVRVAWAPEGGLMLAMFQIPNKFHERDGRVTDASGADWESAWGRVLTDEASNDRAAARASRAPAC